MGKPIVSLTGLDKYGRPIPGWTAPTTQENEGVPAPSRQDIIDVMSQGVTTELEHRLIKSIRRGKNLRRAPDHLYNAIKKNVDGDETFHNGVRKAYVDERKTYNRGMIYTRPDGNVVLRGSGHQSRQAPSEDTLLRQVQAMERELARLNEQMLKMMHDKENAE